LFQENSQILQSCFTGALTRKTTCNPNIIASSQFLRFYLRIDSNAVQLTGRSDLINLSYFFQIRKPKVITITPNSIKYLLTILIILLFAGIASALPTVSHGTLRGEMYVSSTANWPSKDTTNNFAVPNGTVVFARYYVGIWAGQSTHDTITATFNGHAFATNPSYYSTEMGVTWIPYDVTDYLRPGETNIAAINSASWGDGRQYGSTLVVLLKNESKPQIEYWVAEGCDWMHYDGYLGYDASNSTTYFNGTVDFADIQNASLYSTHLTGYNYEDLNGNSLPNAAESVGGEYFNYIRWDNITGALVPENQTVLVSRGSDTYCSAVFHALSIVYEKPDLVPVNLTPTTVVPNTSNILTTTIENQGDKNSKAFNVSLLVDGTVEDTQTITSLASESNTNVDFHWTPYGTTNSYTLTVNVDPENTVNEVNESNNILTTLVGTTTASIPIADFIATPTSGDAPLTVQFTDTSTNTPITWFWDFGDGTNSTDQNPTHIYTTGKKYTVKLTATNAAGSNTDEKIEYITALASPVADFKAIPTTGASPLIVNFTDKSSNLPTSWLWDFGDGTSSTEQDPTHTYTTGGRYTVKLTVTNIAGTNTTMKIGYITVSGVIATGPIWAVKSDWNVPKTGTYTNPCLIDLDDDGDYDLLIGAYDGITYAYENTGNISNPMWTRKAAWDAPDIGTFANPYLADLDGDGDYDLLIGAYNGFTYAYENTGNISNPMWTRKAAWDASDIGDAAVPCLADLDGDGDYDLLIGSRTGITYAYENTGNISYPRWTRKTAWDIPDLILNNDDFANPYLADLDGDGDYDLLIGSKMGTSFAYENTGTTSSSAWMRNTAWDAPSIGSRSSPCLSDLDSDGDYDLLIGTNDGVTYAYENTALSAVAKPDITPTAIISQSGIVANSLHSIGATINNIGTGNTGAFNATFSVNGTIVDTEVVSGITAGSSASINFSWTPTAAGDYNLTVTVDPENMIAESNETNNSLTITVTALAAFESPVANFTADVIRGTAPLTVQFNDNSTGSPTSWQWDFNNDRVVDSNDKSPSYTYSAAGTYTVNLTVANAGGSDSEVKVDYITVSAPETSDTTKPVIDSVVMFPANTTTGSTINISVNATDNVGVTGVTAGTVSLIKDSNGVWQGSIIAPSSVGSYSQMINASDAAGNVAETSAPYNVVQLSGSSSVSVSPKISSVTAGSNVSPAIVVKNAQSIDDTFKVWVSVSELPASSQANLSWFGWTEQSVKIKAGEEIPIPIKADIPSGIAAGLKLFRANVKSETTGITGFNTGYLKIA
jgi:PKD repeat protein